VTVRRPSELAQDLAIGYLVTSSTRMTTADKVRVLERAYPALPQRAAAILVAQAGGAYVVQGFAKYPLHTAFYMRANVTALSAL
jgi:hypothetical protein